MLLLFPLFSGRFPCLVKLHVITYFLISNLVQEEIKINSVSVFVNPYSEPDEEEEEKKTEEEKTLEDVENVSVVVTVMVFIAFYFLLRFLIFMGNCSGEDWFMV